LNNIERGGTIDKDILSRMERLYKAWSTEALVRATTIAKNDYEPDAITVMLKELDVRNISQENFTFLQKDIGQEKEVKAKTQISGTLKFFLGATIGYLFYALRESIIYFNRFVDTPGPLFFVLTVSHLFIFIYGIFIFQLLLRKKNNAPLHTLRWLYCVFGLGIFDGMVFVLFLGIITGLLVTSVPILYSLGSIMYFKRSK
jgi:hypothetical protein